MKSFFRVSTIFFLTKSYMEVLDSNYMAVNIEMNYFNGSSYVALRPMGDFGNMSGSLSLGNNVPKKQILSYTGNGADSLSLALSENVKNPFFIIGGIANNYSQDYYTCYGFLRGSSNIATIYCVRPIAADNFNTFVAVFEIQSYGDSIYFRPQSSGSSSTRDYGFVYQIPTTASYSGGNITGGKDTISAPLQGYNKNNTPYAYLILY